MVRRIILFFMFFFIINFSVCFCAETNPTITLEQSEAIFDFILNISHRPSVGFKNDVNSSTPIAFMKYFNDNIAQQFYNSTNGECNSSSHFIVSCDDSGLYFFVTNATLSNELPFVTIVPSTSTSGYNVSSDYGIRISFSGNNSFSFYGSVTKITQRTTLFYYPGTTNGSQSPFYDENMTTLLTPNLFYLGAKPQSEVSFQAFDSDTSSWYFLEHCYGSSDIPSGDTPSGDTPSGDISSGETPNYNDKLDNISGLITNTNSKLDGISGEIGQTNNKLDGISGELGEINDNLTTVPDLSGTIINSGDIESALNFDFAEDPYSNFWLELNTGLSSALTSINRSININFRNKVYTISLDDFALQVPQFLKSFLAIISTTLVVWQIVRYIKIIIDKISSGDMDSVLAMNEEERNC